jgi:hypothetical protein
MALLSLGENRWRMIRRALRMKRFRYEDCRNWNRQDKGYFAWLVRQGFFAAIGDGHYEVTAKGEAAADLGFYEYEPTPRPRRLARRNPQPGV